MKAASFQSLEKRILSCNLCPRLREHCSEVASVKRAAYRDETYWGRPVPGFGDAKARLILVGLAPGAHGANRTGRVFTGDRSGDWLYGALHRAGFANQAESTSRDDGLLLQDAWVTCAARCAPPGNKPLPQELSNCSAFLEEELSLLPRAQVFLALGQIALQMLWPKIAPPELKRPRFEHGSATLLPDGRWVLQSYHPSQQNTFTGRLTEPMFDSVFEKARDIIRQSGS